MGSFFGHALPGSFFIIVGLWWTFQNARFWANGAHRKRITGAGQIRVIFPFLSIRGPVESYFMMAACIIGTLIEFYSSFGRDDHNIDAKDLQHSTMYAIFGIHSLAACLNWKQILIPKGSDYFTGAFAFFIEALLFAFHIQHQESIEKGVHVLLVIAILGCAIVTLIEAAIPHSLGFKFVRAFFIILQGTWFWQTGFLLYNPFGEPWKPTVEHMLLMWLSVWFSWHSILIMAVQFLIILVVWLCINGQIFTVEKEFYDFNQQVAVNSDGYALLETADGLKE